MFGYVGNSIDDTTQSGIFGYAVDEDSGNLVAGQFVNQERPDHLAISRARHRLYAVSQVPFSDGEAGGAVYAYSVDPHTGQLAELNHLRLPLTFPAYVSLDASERFAFVAATSGGGVAVLALRSDGGLDQICSVTMHEGSVLVPLGSRKRIGPKPIDACQPHAMRSDPSNRLVVVPDLTANRLVAYRFDVTDGTLVKAAGDLVFDPGTGPRHFLFHPDGGRLYLVNETASSAMAIEYDAEGPSFHLVGNVSTIPGDFSRKNRAAEVAFDPAGRFLYCTNRGHDSIAILQVLATPPYLAAIDWQSSGGKAPRGIAISPPGRHLYVANRDSNSIGIFERDQVDGRLTHVGKADVPAPSSIVFS